MRRHQVEVDGQVRPHGRQHRHVHAAIERILHHLVFSLPFARHLARPVHDVMLQHGGPPLVHSPAADRDAGLVHSRRVAGDERVPPEQVPPLCHEPVGAARRQPVDLGQRRGRERNAVRHLVAAPFVIAAAAGLQVEEAAGDVGEGKLVGVLVAQLVQAAPAAAVTQRFPLVAASSRRAIWISRTAPGWPWCGYRRRWSGSRTPAGAARLPASPDRRKAMSLIYPLLGAAFAVAGADKAVRGRGLRRHVPPARLVARGRCRRSGPRRSRGGVLLAFRSTRRLGAGILALTSGAVLASEMRLGAGRLAGPRGLLLAAAFTALLSPGRR